MYYNSDPLLLCEPKTDYLDTKGPHAQTDC